MTDYILAIDQGTTSIKAVLVDSSMNVVASTGYELPQIYPCPGWVEHDPQELLGHIMECLEAAGPVDVIGIDNQGESCPAWDADTGKAVSAIIVWQDNRTQGVIERLKAEGHEALTLSRAGLPLDPYFSATKLEWLLQNVAGLREQAERGQACFGTIDSWLIWQLTGKHITDYTNASRTMLFDIHRLAWDEDLLDLFGVPPQMLPEVRPSSEPNFYGRACAFGHVPVCGDLGDQQAALFGQLAWEAGEAKDT